MATVTSHGAAGVVTGSSHLLSIENGPNILIDCGMFQGREEDRNTESFGFVPSSVDYLLLTHAHLDHVGRIPKLVKEGFERNIVATMPTRDLVEVILLDSAKIMFQDYETHYKKAMRKGKEESVPQPLYLEDDVHAVFALPWRYVEYDKQIELCEGVKVTYKNAGHILGSAFIEIEYIEHGAPYTIVFSGDIGNDNDMVMPNLARCKHADYLYVESTYGDRDHKNIDDSIVEFKKVIIDTLQNWGNVVIPSFAVERTQEILCLLREMYDKKELPECKIFVDSPMATRATEVYVKYVEQLSEKCQKNREENGSIFDFPLLNYTADAESSIAINDVERRAIIIAGSGMCTGGRLLHHFKQSLWNPKNSIIFVGYQGSGTLGRHIVDGAKWVKIYGEDILIKANIHTINGFSAHIDQSGLLDWISKIDDLKTIFLIHGEEDKQTILRSVLENALEKKVHIVKADEVVYL
jgi:metallo-beta-lactamase family protein